MYRAGVQQPGAPLGGQIAGMDRTLEGHGPNALPVNDAALPLSGLI